MLLLWQRFILYKFNLQLYMKIYDCFMFFDEEMLLDLRLNVMDKYVDKFVISESSYMHSGKSKKLIFDINKFSKFKDKIIYIVVDTQPANLEIINEKDSNDTKGSKLINNSVKRENFQREAAKASLDKSADEDIILINDIDEIPNLNEINFNNINKKLIIFKQKTFCYKFNLLYQNLTWHGSRACKKKNLHSPQWLRNIKYRKYPIWRFDIIFSKKKYNNIHYVENGGWHFVNIKTPEEIEKKLKNFGHHAEFKESGLKLDDIKNMVNSNRAIYDYHADMRESKWSSKEKLQKCDLSQLPDYLVKNQDKYSAWLE